MKTESRNNVLIIILSAIGAIMLALFTVFASAFLEDFRETKKELTDKVNNINKNVDEIKYDVGIIRFRLRIVEDAKGVDLSPAQGQEGEVRTIGVLQAEINRDR